MRLMPCQTGRYRHLRIWWKGKQPVINLIYRTRPMPLRQKTLLKMSSCKHKAADRYRVSAKFSTGFLRLRAICALTRSAAGPGIGDSLTDPS
jgi:hypothetical protein